MPLTQPSPPLIHIPDDGDWRQLEEAVIAFISWARYLTPTGPVRIRHLWTGDYYEYEPPVGVEITVHLFSWYNRIDARVLRAGAGETFVAWR